MIFWYGRDKFINMSFLANNHIYRSIIESTWKIVFQHSPSEEVTHNIDQFIKFGAGMLVARLLSISTQVIMGRQFGPQLYGQITIVLLLASYFAMPMINGWGLVFTKISARTDFAEEKLNALKSLLVISLFSSCLMIILLLIFKEYLVAWLDISEKMVKLIIIMSLCYSWWMLSKMISQGYQNWFQYIVIENIWAFSIFIGLILIRFNNVHRLTTICMVFFAGYIIAGLVIIKKFVQAIRAHISKPLIKDMLLHGWYLLLNGLVGVATFSVDRILINMNLGAEDVGIYQAHFLSTYGIISAFMTILLTYVFPAFCRDEKNNIHSVMEKVAKIQYPVTIIVSIVTGSIVLWLYSYPVSISLFVCLCLFNAVQFHVQLKTWYIASKGIKASKITLTSQIIFLITNVAVLLTLIHQVGIIAGGFSLFIAASASLLYLTKNEQLIFHERTI